MVSQRENIKNVFFDGDEDIACDYSNGIFWNVKRSTHDKVRSVIDRAYFIILDESVKVSFDEVHS
jgi:hypothetical protein